MTFYTPIRIGATKNAVFEISDGRGPLAQTAAETCRHPDTLKKTNEYGGLDPESYPHYIVARANGVTEILEFRRPGPQFWISDDAALVAQATEAVANGSCFGK